LLWLLVVLPAIVLAGVHWHELTANLSDQVLAAHNLLLLWLVYPLIKALHELGHAYAVKSGDGEVHEMGIMLLVLAPIPYVDATAAGAFRSKWRRALVGAAGMLVELFLAAIAMLGLGDGRARAGALDRLQRALRRRRLDAALQRQSAAALRRLLRSRRSDRDRQSRQPLESVLAMARQALPLFGIKSVERPLARPASGAGFSSTGRRLSSTARW
jgi:hypothetical protein